MALPIELIEYQRLRELTLESDLLRASFCRQCAYTRTRTFWIEQGVSVAAWFLGPTSRVGRVLAIASRVLSQ